MEIREGFWDGVIRLVLSEKVWAEIEARSSEQGMAIQVGEPQLEREDISI